MCLMPCAQELLSLMGYYQYAHLATSGQPFPLWTADLLATAQRAVAGNATWPTWPEPEP